MKRFLLITVLLLGYNMLLFSQVRPTAVTIVWSNTELVYNGKPQAPTATATVRDRPVDLPLVVKGEETNVGKYKAEAFIDSKDAENFTLTNETTQFVINPLAVAVRWANISLTYNGKPQSPVASIRLDNRDVLMLAVKGEGTNVGIYQATAFIDSKDADNFILSNETTKFEITPATIAVEWDDLSFIYNGKLQTPTAMAIGVLNEKIRLAVKGEGIDVGTYNAMASLDAKEDNYVLSNDRVTFVITKARVPVDWSNTTLTYNGSPQAPTAIAAGVLGEKLQLTVTGAQTNPGTYTATAALPAILGAPDNYTLTNATTTFTIVGNTQQTVEVVWSYTVLTYNGSPQAPTAKATVGSGPSSFDLPLKITGAQTEAGGYTATASIDGNYPDYTLTNETYYFYINQAPITAQWSNLTLTYNGEMQQPSATAKGIFGENLPITVYGAKIDIGEYVAYAYFTPEQNNYYLENSATQFFIVPEGQGTYLFVQWGNNDLTYNGKSQTPTATATTGNGVNVPLKITGSGTNVGWYEAMAEIDLNTAHDYILVNPTLDFWIEPARAIVKWDQTLPFTGMPQMPNISVTGVLGENLPIEVWFDEGNGGNEDGATALGTYYCYVYLYYPESYYAVPGQITTKSGPDDFYINDNYYIQSGEYGNESDNILEFEIVPAQIPVQWSNTSLIYNGQPQRPTATATGVMGEPLMIRVTGAQTEIGTGYYATAALTQTISKSPFLSASNYVLINETTTFDIVDDSPTALYITVTWGNTSLTYNGQPQIPSFTFTNNLGFSDLPISAWGEQINAGTGYSASVSMDYFPFYGEIYFIDAETTFDIKPVSVPVQWSKTMLLYNGSPQAPSARAKGIYDEDLTLTVTGEQTEVGTYTATATCDDTISSYYDPYYQTYQMATSNYALENPTTLFDIYNVPTTPNTYIIQWSNTSLTYNGHPQMPHAVAINNQGETLPVTVSGAQTNVGTGYTATASLNITDNNAEIVNATTLFSIKPAYITVQWGNTMLFYNGEPQAPTASARGVMNEDLPLNVTGEETEVGEDYEALASLRTANSNYVLINIATLFDIVQLTSNDYIVEWGDTKFTYNGEPQAPTASAKNQLGESVALTVTGAQTNADTRYTATASLSAPIANAVLINATTLFDIAPAPLAITAVSTTIDYGQTPALDYTLTSGQLFGSDALTGALSVETLQATPIQPPYPAGEYAIVQGTLTAGSNYLINFTKGSLTVLSIPTEDVFDIFVNDKSTQQEGDQYKADPAENGEAEAVVYVLANPGETITIGGETQNPRTVNLKYGDNPFTITVTPQNGTPKNYTLIIERYYEKVMLEYVDVPTISCNPQTNGGLTFTGFQWYRSGEAIDNATRPYYQVKDNAIYYCELTSSSGKMRTINILPQSLRISGRLMAYPNPTQGKVTVQQNVNASGKSSMPISDVNGKVKIQVFDINGNLVLQPDTNPFDMSLLPQGLYLIKVNDETVKVFKTN